MHDVIPNLTAEDRERSLGWLALWWIQSFCVVGSEPAYDMPVYESPEYARFYVDCYALDKYGQRRFNHVFLSRPKGCDKSGKGGRLGLFELWAMPFRRLGEGRGNLHVPRPDLRVSAGPEPMGRPVQGPNVVCIATAEEQTDNVYQVMKYNCENGPLSQLRGYGLMSVKPVSCCRRVVRSSPVPPVLPRMTAASRRSSSPTNPTCTTFPG